MNYETKKRIGGTRELVDVDADADADAFAAALEVSAEAASPLLTNRHQDYRMTRRSIFIGAAASLLCAPAIVQVASLMPVRSLILPIKRSSRLDPLGEFYRRCFYHNLDFDLRTGRSMSMVVENGKIISVADARRMVALARAQGWLPPYSPKI